MSSLSLGLDLADSTVNLLPQDGCVNYWGKVFTEIESLNYFVKLMQEIDWRNDEAFIYGKHYITKRKVAWYGDLAYPYSYSGITRVALPWNQTLKELKQKAEIVCDCEFNSCLLNLYPSGEEGMAWHSDDEPSLQKHSEIASFSFGAERKFAFKHKSLGVKVELRLENGSLLLMKESTQTHWLHRLPPTKKINSPRINLTFRKMK